MSNNEYFVFVGMADHLTFALAAGGYHAHKLVLYGAQNELTPWLFRRLAENKVQCVVHIV
ncbi:hypothetical protein EON64_02205 [archaeon]|nr:MAG: hypothetical protein EON64_02205 [archaeon]